jgi:LPXTG-site transpeptidase (sortase) family protein
MFLFRKSKKLSKTANSNSFQLKNLLKLILLLSLIILFLIYFPVVKEEILYFFNKPDFTRSVSLTKKANKNVIKPVNNQFAIVIPKINVNSSVVENVSPFNSEEYQTALTKGVAHSITSAVPGKGQNVFIFAHSAGNFYYANRFNAIFYLIHKLDLNDNIYIIYKGKKHHYQVKKKIIVDSKRTDYLYPQFSNNESLTLMTCWPPGTTLKRLIVVANIVE